MLLHLKHTSAVYIMVHTVPCMAPRLLARNVCVSSSKPDKVHINSSLLLPTKPLGLNPGSTGMDESFALTLSGLRLTQKFQLGKNMAYKYCLEGRQDIYVIPSY